MAHVYIVISCPDEKLKPCLAHIKQFDDGDNESASMVEVVVHAPALGEAKTIAMFQELGMPYHGKVRWAEKAAKMEWRADNG